VPDDRGQVRREAAPLKCPRYQSLTRHKDAGGIRKMENLIRAKAGQLPDVGQDGERHG